LPCIDPAVAIAIADEPVEPTGNRAAASTDTEWRTVERFGDPLHVAVAREAPRRLVGDVEVEVAENAAGDSRVGP
jgi:hypothetical protein